MTAPIDDKDITQATLTGGSPKQGEIYQHYKGGLYTVVARAIREDTFEPLLHHILAVDARACHNCQHWLPYNHTHAHEGECLNPDTQRRLVSLTAKGEIAHTTTAVVTPFDWHCKGWLARAHQESSDACQAKLI